MEYASTLCEVLFFLVLMPFAISTKRKTKNAFSIRFSLCVFLINEYFVELFSKLQRKRVLNVTLCKF